MIRKIYNKYYKKNFDFPVITNNNELDIYIRTQIYLDYQPKPTETLLNDYNTKILETAKIYKKLNLKSIETTLDYIFNKYRTGIYVKIENNQLSQFVTLYNANFTNDFSQALKFKDGNVYNYIKSKQNYYKGRISKITPNINKWASTNCLLRTEQDDEGPTERYLPEFFDMINKTCQNRQVNDCIFFIYRKDFPNLTLDYTEADEHIWNSTSKPLADKYQNTCFIPILAQSTTDRHANLLLPTGDDWDIITQEFEEYKMENIEIPKWESRQNKIIWRGAGTGCGTNPETNPRIKLTLMSQELLSKNIDYLDAGIINFPKRDKKVYGSEYVEFTKNTFDLKPFPYVDRFDQIKAKFTINIEGNSAAYRYGSLFKLGYCILNVESKYKLWFEQWLEPYVHYIPVKHDLSDLIEKIEWCLANDSKCKKISENGQAFYNKYMTREFIYDYMANTINQISKKYDLDDLKPIYQKDRIQKGLAEYNQLRCNIKSGYPASSKEIRTINKENTLIIVPYRDNKFQDRKKQLELFKEHYKDYNVLIVEQTDDGRKFNRGALLNIGFKYSYKNYKYFIFHDVDILTPHDIINSMYFDDIKGSIHLGNITDKCIGCKLFFGAINKFDAESFKEINGFPNTFWGWGDEDVALYYRCCKKNIIIYKPQLETRVKELEHDMTNKIEELTNMTRYEKRIFDNIYNEIDGLLQCTYFVKATQSENKYKKITVDIK